jgi:ubiquitin-protein ligase
MTPELSPYAREAFAAFRNPQSRIYLGGRYGVTPHYLLPAETARDFLGADPGSRRPQLLCQLASRLEKTSGRERLLQTFADKYGVLEVLDSEVQDELEVLSPIVVGKVLVSGTYSSFMHSMFRHVSLATCDAEVMNIRREPGSTNTFVVMLHGQQSNPGGALLTKEEVDSFVENRPGLDQLVRSLLREHPWIVLAFDRDEDDTFARLCGKVCDQLGPRQRPIYVVDPRESEVVASEWPRDPLRHVRLQPLEFLRLLTKSDSRPSPSMPPHGDRPAPPGAGGTPQTGAVDGGEKAQGPPPGDGSPPETPRTLRLEIESLDGRLFRVNAPVDLRISALASQFIRRHVHGDGGGSRSERAVVDVDREGNWQRQNGNDTLEDAGIEDGTRMRVYSDTVAGSVDPRRREEYLNAVQTELEELASHDQRISARPNLPKASDRYEIGLHCGGWGPPESIAENPYRTEQQQILIEYPAEAPDAPPVVWWQSPIFHPNVAKSGYVCLGALQKSFTPLFGPRELVHMLIELSEYRNYELQGVLNREAAIWAQLHPELITDHGGWAYQPTLGEKRDENESMLEFKPGGTGVGLRRSRKS